MMADLGRYRFEGISVAIIDDHEVVLEGLRSFLSKGGISHVETFCKPQPLLDRIHAHPFTVYIVDVELPDMDASELIDQIRDLHPEAKIIINTMHDELWVVSKMTEKKVDGVIYKSGQLNQLLEAIEVVANGQQYFCRKFKQSQEQIRVSHNVLTAREIEVLQEIAKGYPTKLIGPRLFISENTVETHRQALFTKLKAHNMADLIVKAIAAGYINPDEIVKT